MMRPTTSTLAALMLGVCLLTAPARADGAAQATGDQTEAKSADAKKPKKKPRCACAKPRLLRLGKSVVLDDATAQAAFVEEVPEGASVGSGGARLATLAADFFDRKTSGVDDLVLPIRTEPFPLSTWGKPVDATHTLVRAWAEAPTDDPFFVAVVRKGEAVPKDVVRAKTAKLLAGIAPAPSARPRLENMWLGPYEARETESCGAQSTHRLLFEPKPDSPKVVAFIVRRLREGADGPSEVALVDVRQASTFGLGRVEPCGQGLPLEAQDTDGDGVVDFEETLELLPVSAGFGVGEAWRFRRVLAPAMPESTLRPDDAGPVLDENPFTKALPARTLGHDEDEAALTTMVGLVGGAGMFAAFLWGMLRRRRRIEETLACPVCATSMTLDLTDAKSDGMFCPNCGKAAVYVSFDAAGMPTAHVMRTGD